MKRFGWIALCLALVVGLCACKKKPDEPVVSTPVSDVGDGDSQSQSTTSTTTTTTTGALVVTDTQGTVVTNIDGTPQTTHVTALPTTVRPVTDPSGSTVTKEDGTVQTEVVVPPHITVSTDAQGTTHTSYVPEQTVTTTTSTTTTTTTGALVVTDTQGTVVTNIDGTPETTHVTALPTTVRPVTDPSGSTVTKEDGTVQTEVVVPPHITVSTDAQGTTHTSYVPVQTVTTTTTTESTSTTESTTSTTKPTQQDAANTVSLPAEGYTPDNRIKLGEVTLSGNTVSMIIRNISAVWESEEGQSYFEYTCYDKNNRKLSVGKIEFGYIQAKGSKLCTFEIPENTVKVELTDFKAEYWSIPV